MTAIYQSHEVYKAARSKRTGRKQSLRSNAAPSTTQIQSTFIPAKRWCAQSYPILAPAKMKQIRTLSCWRGWVQADS